MKKKVDVGELLTKLTDAVVNQYLTDPTTPGLTISHLKDGYYVSVVQYTGKMATGKYVVAKATGKTLLAAASACAKTWVDALGHVTSGGLVAVHMDGGG